MAIHRAPRTHGHFHARARCHPIRQPHRLSARRPRPDGSGATPCAATPAEVGPQKPTAKQPAYTIPQLLMAAGVHHEPYTKARGERIFLTAANQLIGTYADLRRFRQASVDHAGWEGASHRRSARPGASERPTAIPALRATNLRVAAQGRPCQADQQRLAEENPSHLQAAADI